MQTINKSFSKRFATINQMSSRLSTNHYKQMNIVSKIYRRIY